MPPPSDPEPAAPRILDSIAAVRTRPGMYVGDVQAAGLMHYLVGALALLLRRGATRVDMTVGDEGLAIDSDARLGIGRTGDGRITPFEVIAPHESDGFVLNALSRSLVVRCGDGTASHEITYRRGERVALATGEAGGCFARLEFAPDDSIFAVVGVSAAILASYLRRLGYLHPGVRFRLTVGGGTTEFHAPGGIGDLFESVAAPYQLLHEPIRVAGSDGPLGLELVFAYHDWVEHPTWCFINGGRAVEGGTHEVGLLRAFDRLARHFQMSPRRGQWGRNGVVAVMAITYPGAVFEGAMRIRIGNPELAGMVSRLVVATVMRRLADQPELARSLGQLRTLPFPEVWRG